MPAVTISRVPCSAIQPVEPLGRPGSITRSHAIHAGGTVSVSDHGQGRALAGERPRPGTTASLRRRASGQSARGVRAEQHRQLLARLYVRAARRRRPRAGRRAPADGPSSEPTASTATSGRRAAPEPVGGCEAVARAVTSRARRGGRRACMCTVVRRHGRACDRRALACGDPASASALGGGARGRPSTSTPAARSCCGTGGATRAPVRPVRSSLPGRSWRSARRRSCRRACRFFGAPAMRRFLREWSFPPRRRCRFARRAIRGRDRVRVQVHGAASARAACRGSSPPCSP